MNVSKNETVALLSLKDVKFFSRFSKVSQKEDQEVEQIPNAIKKKLDNNLNDTKACIINMKDELKEELKEEMKKVQDKILFQLDMVQFGASGGDM